MSKSYPPSVALFPSGYRASGVVLDVGSLPSPYGIGDFGPSALSWVDRLREAGQGWWHSIQLSGSADYNRFSSFAANELWISPDWLVEDGLLSPRDCECIAFSGGAIHYDVVVPFKHWLLEKAWKRFNAGTRKDLSASYEKFRKAQGHWLEDYALFRALKAKYRGADYREWPAELVRRSAEAIATARHQLTNQIDQFRFSQFLVSRQTQRLKGYAHANGVRLIGDSPFFISTDSSEAWAHPELFAGDEQCETAIANVMVPFCFSLSGRPGSDHDRRALSRVSHRWCVDRLRALLAHVDVACVSDRELTATRRAEDDATATRDNAHGDGTFIGVGGLLDGRELEHAEGFAFRAAHVPEMRVLRLAFDGCSDNPHLPQNYKSNSAVYTGVYDAINPREWFTGLPDQQQRALRECTNRPLSRVAEVAWELIRMAWSSSASLAMAAFPDLLNLGPDTTGENSHTKGLSRWRCSEAMLSNPAFYWLRELTKTTNRWVEVKNNATPAVHHSPKTQARNEAVM